MKGTSNRDEGLQAILWLCFSPNGRVSSGWYWASVVALLPSNLIFKFSENAVLLLVGLAMALILLIPSLMISIKRWHDIGKSGWYVLVNLVPIIGPLYALWQQGFVNGTPGTNSYGPDPRDESDGPVVRNTSSSLPRQRGTGTGSVRIPAAYRTDRLPADRS